MSISKFLVLLFAILFAVSAAFAQDRTPSENGPPASDAPLQRDGRRPNLLRELALSRDQLQQIRKMNAERKPQMETAQESLRNSIRALDAAIYADTVNQDEVAARIKDFQSAQAEVARLRFNSELTVRQILTPEQLVRFRELRRQFEEERANRRDKRRQTNGLRRFQKLPAQNRPPGNAP